MAASSTPSAIGMRTDRLSRRARPCSRSRRTTVSGSSPSLVLPSRPTIVGDISSELSTDSSDASTTASNRSSSPRMPSRRPSSSTVPSRSVRAVVLTARKISPLPWCAVEPVRARPSPTRRASRSQPSGSTGASVTTTPMHEPAGFSGPAHVLGQQPPDRHAVDGEPGPLAEVGHQHAPRRCGRPGRHPRRRTDPALEAQAGHPGAAAHRPLFRRGRRADARRAPPSWAARTSSAVSHIVRTSLRKESSHSATTGTQMSSASSG